MWAAVFLFMLFVAGLISTNFPRKKLIVWVESFWVGIRGLRYENISSRDQKPTQEDHREVKRSVTSDVSKAQLRKVFSTFDKNNDGFITKLELRDSMKNMGIAMSEGDVDDMIRRVDANGDGLIDLDEFCESFDSLIARGAAAGEEVEEQSGVERDGDLQEAFDVFDGDKDGVITVEELGLVLSSLGFKEGKKMEDCKEMIRQVDMDGDGMVNFPEFKKMMKSGHRLVPIS